MSYEDYEINAEGLADVQAMEEHTCITKDHDGFCYDEEMNWFVTRDGSTISPGMATENDAHRWLQRHQPMSNDWAMKYEGYGIREITEQNFTKINEYLEDRPVHGPF